MTIESKDVLKAQLTESAKRMKEIRIAGEKLRLLRLGNEPDPRPLQPLLTQPAPRFSGQPERSDPTL